MEDHDSPWKEALECFFQPFLQLLYPDIHDAVDWTRSITFLDKELQRITRRGRTGRRQADKLVRVWFHDGRERWMLIHVEVQGGRETAFPERMFIYYHRIRDRYRTDVISLAVLADTDPGYRPDSFETLAAGSGVHFRFRTVKLLDFRDRLDELLHGGNPFGLLVAAQLTAKLERDGRCRVDNLIGFYRLAIAQKMDRELINRLLVFLEWMVALPVEIEGYYTEQVDLLEEEETVAYVSMLEKIAEKRFGEKIAERFRAEIRQEVRQEGRQEGLKEGRATLLAQLLRLKFGDLPDETRLRLDEATEAELDTWAERVLFASSIEEVFR